ncbi:hypothetical protein NQ314_001060 [Rhamnusium bicolor]|uniref:PiggyBac transposable element-derived protein domain-containing protein n=1 Tax=Rhamnusium bicolor TaxID=1586634 RepID=A0AAV8ZUQ2_9CUCU|nr:hypothetical protein NQ314_001060 [Rhamnusium bicolor]
MSVDEMMIPFKGRSGLKQYVPKIPCKWGYKVWAPAGILGYVYCFEIYYGGVNVDDSKNAGVGGEVVKRLCHDIAGRNYKIYADNYFSNIQLLLDLRDKQIWYVGTIRFDRLQGLYKLLKSKKEMKSLGRGATNVMTSSKGLTVVQWYDNALVHTISTYAGIYPQDTDKRFSKKQIKHIQIGRPFAIKTYNDHMGGVDLMDFL